MKLNEDELLNLLITEGWHISDGVDSCSGEDEEAMLKSVKKILKIIL
jgi:hypothetical protein